MTSEWRCAHLITSITQRADLGGKGGLGQTQEDGEVIPKKPHIFPNFNSKASCKGPTRCVSLNHQNPEHVEPRANMSAKHTPLGFVIMVAQINVNQAANFCC